MSTDDTEYYKTLRARTVHMRNAIIGNHPQKGDIIRRLVDEAARQKGMRAVNSLHTIGNSIRNLATPVLLDDGSRVGPYEEDYNEFLYHAAPHLKRLRREAGDDPHAKALLENTQ